MTPEQCADLIRSKVVHIHRTAAERDQCEDGCGWLNYAANLIDPRFCRTGGDDTPS